MDIVKVLNNNVQVLPQTDWQAVLNKPALLKGDKGDTGAQGLQGVKGDKGDKGDTGTNATTTAIASTTANGLMSKEDKVILNKLNTNVITFEKVGEV